MWMQRTQQQLPQEQPPQQQPAQQQPPKEQSPKEQPLQQQPSGQHPLQQQLPHEVSMEVRQLLAAQLKAAEQVLELGRKLEIHLGPLRGGEEDHGSFAANGNLPATLSSGTKGETHTCNMQASSFGQERTLPDSSIVPAPVQNTGGLLEPLLAAEVQKTADLRTTSPRTSETENTCADLKGAHLGLFPDVDRLKEQAKDALAPSEYNVEDEYHTEGVFQEIARSKGLKNATCAMIVLNAIWIGVDTDWNHAPALYYAAPVFQIMENVFCSFFTFEIVVRFCAFKIKRRAFADAWFLFDGTLVSLMVWETWVVTSMLAMGMSDSGVTGDTGAASVFRLLRLLRLSRVLRIGRLLKEMPEFMMLAKGMVIGLRSVFSTLVLMVAIIYVFAIIFVQLLSDTPAAPGCFENVPLAINCLFLNSALSDQSSVLDKVLAEDLFTYLIALFYFIIGCLTLMNMLIGALCEVVSVVAREQSEASKVEACKEKLMVLLGEMDEDSDMMISKEEFMKIMVNPDMMKMLVELEVDVEAFFQHADVVVEGDCDVSSFVDIVMQFRSSNSATVKDLVSIKKDLSELRKYLTDKVH